MPKRKSLADAAEAAVQTEASKEILRRAEADADLAAKLLQYLQQGLFRQPATTAPGLLSRLVSCCFKRFQQVACH